MIVVQNNCMEIIILIESKSFEVDFCIVCIVLQRRIVILRILIYKVEYKKISRKRVGILKTDTLPLSIIDVPMELYISNLVEKICEYGFVKFR